MLNITGLMRGERVMKANRRQFLETAAGALGALLLNALPFPLGAATNGAAKLKIGVDALGGAFQRGIRGSPGACFIWYPAGQRVP